MTLDFWRNNVNQLLEFQGESVLTNNGSVSNIQMEDYVRNVYDDFDARRKKHDALLADAEDLKLLDEIENKTNICSNSRLHNQ